MPRRKADAQENVEKKQDTKIQDTKIQDTKMQDAKMQPKEEKQPGIEENFVRLEEIIRKLEAGDITLEESFTCYEAGMKLVKSLGSQIDKVEKKIQILSEGDENE